MRSTASRVSYHASCEALVHVRHWWLLPRQVCTATHTVPQLPAHALSCAQNFISALVYCSIVGHTSRERRCRTLMERVTLMGPSGDSQPSGQTPVGLHATRMCMVGLRQDIQLRSASGNALWYHSMHRTNPPTVSRRTGKPCCHEQYTGAAVMKSTPQATTNATELSQDGPRSQGSSCIGKGARGKADA